MVKRKDRADVDRFAKKQKTDNGDVTTEEKSTLPEKCSICRQQLSNVLFYNGHQNSSTEEFIALTHDSLSVFTGDENNIHESDERPYHKITHFSVYDGNGHLCPFDTGLVEKNVILHISGYLKPIYDEDTTTNNGIPAHDIGPINEWYITGFDGGEKALVGVTTAYGQYFLIEPSPEYAPFMNVLKRKIFLVKIVIEYLLGHVLEDPTYEDLLFYLQSVNNVELTEDFLLQHAQFLCDQIYSFDQAGEEDEKQLITTPCVRNLVQMCGVTFRKRKQLRQLTKVFYPRRVFEHWIMQIFRFKDIQKKNNEFTKATTTALVRSIFENFFPDQIETGKDLKGPRKKRCGVCDACQSPDCGQCTHCRDMLKFGGTGKSKQACKTRRCPNMAVEDAEQSENENETEEVELKKIKKKVHPKRKTTKVSWCGLQHVFEAKGKKYYEVAEVGGIKIKAGDYVMLNPESPNEPLYIGKVQYMYDTFPQGPTLHAQMLCRGIDTILGETADPQELFVVDQCEDCPLGCIVRKAEVSFREIAKDWSELGGIQTLPLQLDDDGRTFFFNKQYQINTAAFTDYTEQPPDLEIHKCNICRKQAERQAFDTPSLVENEVKWHREVYKPGTAVFLNPSVIKLSSVFASSDTDIKRVNETIYTEYYRKTNDTKGSNLDTANPFCIAILEDIHYKSEEIQINARVFYRPENTKSSVFLSYMKDLNLVYWTADTVLTSFANVQGKCYLKFTDSVEEGAEWCSKGPYRFYFTEAYNPDSYQFYEVPMKAKKIGQPGKGKGKVRLPSTNISNANETAPEWEAIERPLRCMDVFAGCGGLSKGLHQSGIAESKWAIEKEIAAAQAFKLNNKDCRVFTDDCNEILQQVMTGTGTTKGLPIKGDVEMLVGGPPCQGFSGMNRFNSGQPKYFVLENVRNFVSFKRSIVLKLALRCLLAIGYQVTFGILQAGHFGIPQTRRRLILIAAAPGYALPKLPEPQHVFNKRGCHLSFALDGQRFTNGNFWIESAPYRTICVRDAISDLPDITNGWDKVEMPYDDDAISHFQRKVRKNNGTSMLVDHICKEMAPLVFARMSHIPEVAGSDWRDLPNVIVKLCDGTTTAKLHYSYCTKKQKAYEPPRGVCRCALGKGCDPMDRQLNTLIPWCLPHTADRHNNWAGLYGRLEWDGFFGTTITNPEPMGKQGRVLHPEQHRVVSVRECARSQGFPDNFKFYGTIMDKHRQVGNAVPPPLGEAIGLEIKKALASLNTKQII